MLNPSTYHHAPTPAQIIRFLSVQTILILRIPFHYPLSSSHYSHSPDIHSPLHPLPLSLSRSPNLSRSWAISPQAGPKHTHSHALLTPFTLSSPPLAIATSSPSLPQPSTSGLLISTAFSSPGLSFLRAFLISRAPSSPPHGMPPHPPSSQPSETASFSFSTSHHIQPPPPSSHFMRIMTNSSDRIPSIHFPCEECPSYALHTQMLPSFASKLASLAFLSVHQQELSSVSLGTVKYCGGYTCRNFCATIPH